jgi:large subunit ribosomal protein L22
MIAKAISKYIKISPKKVRLLTRPLKGMTVIEAYAFLQNVNKKASHYIYNTLRSAYDNARKKEPDISETDLYISKITADSGPVLKRYRAASMGRAMMIRKRMSHLTIQLDAKKVFTEGKKRKPAAIEKRSLFKRKQGVVRQKSAKKETKTPKQSQARTAKK